MADEESSYAPRSPDLSGYHGYPSETFQQTNYEYGQPHPAQPFGQTASSSYQPAMPPPRPVASSAPKGRGRGRGKKEESQVPLPPVKERDPIEAAVVVKTKFPVARIKRIMQADEDVGKVAQVSPSMVCKCRVLNYDNSSNNL
jgi:hypothetical protein